MNKVFAVLVVLACCVCRLQAQAQDTIITMDGDKIPATGYKILEETQEIEIQQEDGGIKIMDIEDVFSVKAPGSENILYKLDSLQGSYLCADDMKCFIRGMQEAKEGYGASLATLGGLAISVGAVAYAATDGAAINVFWAPVIPIAFCTGVAMTKPNLNRIKRNYPEWCNNEQFMAGYITAARKKRVKNAILSSLTGFVLSAATYYIVQGTED